MESQPLVTSAPPPVPEIATVDSERDQISQKPEAVLDRHTREDQEISPLQRLLERIGLLPAMNPDLVRTALDSKLDPDRLPPPSPAKPPQSTHIPHKDRANHGGNVSRNRPGGEHC